MTATTEEVLKAYKEGYKDGYNDAVKFYIINPNLNMRPQDNVWRACNVCGKSGFRMEVCYNTACPTRVTVNSTGTGAIGAAGSDYFSNLPLGANGPTGGDVK
jgi:hypothetical protein